MSVAKRYLKLCVRHQATQLNALCFLYESYRGKMGTVGAVAVDLQGNLASATSTGGMINKMEGRVGDTPCVGESSDSKLQHPVTMA